MSGRAEQQERKGVQDAVIPCQPLHMTLLGQESTGRISQLTPGQVAGLSSLSLSTLATRHCVDG